MGLLLQKIQKRPDRSPGVSAFAAACGACAAFLCWGEGAADAADLSRALPTKASPVAVTSAADDWTGFYAGGHFGYAAGFSNWTATQAGAATPSPSGSLDLFQGYDFSTGRGSYLLGFQAGYNYMLPSRIVLGAEADVSFPSVLGASQAIASPLIGQAIYRDQVQMSGTVRGRIGYAPGHWLFYATGGFAYSFDEFSRTQVASAAIGGTAVAGTVENLFMVPRIGGAVGGGVEVALTPRWMARLEYLYTAYGSRSVDFPLARSVSPLISRCTRCASDWITSSAATALIRKSLPRDLTHSISAPSPCTAKRPSSSNIRRHFIRLMSGRIVSFRTRGVRPGTQPSAWA